VYMRQSGQQEAQPRGLRLARNPILQRHPILTPLALLAGSLLLGYAALNADDLFPWLSFFGITPFPVYFSIALVSGLAGFVTAIITLVECIDRAPGKTSRKRGLPGDKGAALC
jgi:hypothetical protein